MHCRVKVCARSGIQRDPPASPDRQQHEHESEDGDFEHFARTNAAQVDAHQEGDGNRHGDGESPPRAVFQRVHDDESYDGQEKDQDRNDCGVGDEATDAPRSLPWPFP